MRLHSFENEERIFAHHARIDELTFDVREALFDQWCFNFLAGNGGQFERYEFIDLGAARVADIDYSFCHLYGWNIKDALLTLADELAAVILRPDVATNKGRHKFHNHMPSHRHDVEFSLPRRADEYNRTGLQKSPDFADGKVFLSVGLHVKQSIRRKATRIDDLRRAGFPK